MLRYITSLIPTSFVTSNIAHITPKYSIELRRVIVSGVVQSMNLFYYFMETKDRENMISYIKDGFTKRIIDDSHIDMAVNSGLLYEALPDVITSDHVELYLMYMNTLEETHFHTLMLLFILYPYGNDRSKQHIRQVLDNSAALERVNGRTLEHMLSILTHEEFNDLYNSHMYYAHIYSPIWGYNMSLIKYIANNAEPDDSYRESLYHTCQYILYGISDKETILTAPHLACVPDQIQLLANCYQGNTDDLIAAISRCRPLVFMPEPYSHKYNALLLCLSNKTVEDEIYMYDHFILDDCEFCQRLPLHRI